MWSGSAPSMPNGWLLLGGAISMGMMAIYAADAQELLPGMPRIVGRDAIRAFCKDLLEALLRFPHDFEPQTIMVAAGDLAVVEGRYRFTPDAQAPEQTQVGKFVGVWRRTEDWQLVLNISNADGSTMGDTARKVCFKIAMSRAGIEGRPSA